MQTLQEYKCPCCGGAIAFDSTLQKMKCPFCDTEFEMETLADYDSVLKNEASDDMSWESTVTYYKEINERVAKSLGGLHSAKIVLYSVDFAEVEAQQAKGEWAGSAELLGRAAKGLVAAGADAIVICTNTMHKVADEVERAAGVVEAPVLEDARQGTAHHQVEEPPVARAVERVGGLLEARQRTASRRHGLGDLSSLFRRHGTLPRLDVLLAHGSRAASRELRANP